MKKALSLVLVLVMVVLMLPFASSVTSSAETVTPAVEIDESKYRNLYTADFSKIKSDEELNAAKIYSVTSDGSPEASPIEYTENGMVFTPGNNKSLNFGGVLFNGASDYVIDLTYSYLGNTNLNFQFGSTTAAPASPTSFISNAAKRHKYVILNPLTTFYADSGWFLPDSSFVVKSPKGDKLSSYNPTAFNAIASGADVRIRIFVQANIAFRAIINVGDEEIYFAEYQSALNDLTRGSFFVISAPAVENADNKILIKNIAISDSTENLVELDENKYSPVYSVDFSKIDSEKELNDAGWYSVIKEGTTEKYPIQYTDDGLLYTFGDNKILSAGNIGLRTDRNCVLDFTVSFADSSLNIYDMRFNSTDPTEFSPDVDKRQKIRIRGSFSAEFGWYYKNAEYTEHTGHDSLSALDPEAYELTRTDDVRFRIFSLSGKARYVVINIGDKEFYEYDPKSSLTIEDNACFILSTVLGEGAGDKLLIKKFAVYEYGDNVSAAAEKACISVDGVNRYVVAGTTVDTANFASDILCVKAGDAYSANTELTAVAGNVYDIIRYNGLKAIGAELRLASNPGIRFKTAFADKDFDMITALLVSDSVTDVKIGTLVTIDTYLAGADAFTAEALAAYGETLGKNIYMDIVADVMTLTDATFAGSVIGVKDFERGYVAKAYVTITFADESTVTIYTNTIEAVSVKSLAENIVEANYAGYTADAEKAALDYLATYTAS